MIPVKISIKEKQSLYIKWDDGSESLIGLKKLRRLCPCATCVALRETQSKTFIPIFGENQITISNISKVGKYAISVSWQDGHNTGIYEFPFLKFLSENK